MANQAVRVPEPSVESSSVRCPLGCDYGGRSWRRRHHLRSNKLRTSFGSCHRIALVTIGLSSDSVRTCRGNLADRDSMVGIRPRGLSCRSSTREVGGHSNRRGTVPRHRARISCLGFSDLNRRDATYYWIIDSGRGCARDDGRSGLSRGCRSGSKGSSCIRVL